MSDIYSFTYARPYSGSKAASDSLQGAMHDLFRGFSRPSSKEERLDDLRTNFFFYGREIIMSACKSVDEAHHAKKPYSHFSDHFDVSQYSDDAQRFLDTLQYDVKDAYVFFIELAIKSEVDHIDIRKDERVLSACAAHMKAIWSAHDLTDPRLSGGESLYRANQPAIVNEQTIQSDISVMHAAQAALDHISRDTAPCSTSEDMKLIVEYKSSLQKLITHKKDLQSKAREYEVMAELKSKVGATFLYSRVTSRMGEHGTQEFRERLSKALYSVVTEKSARDLKGEILSMVKAQIGLSRLKFNGDAEIKIYESISEHALRIANDYIQISTGDWARERSGQLGNYIDALEDTIRNSLEAHKDLLTRGANEALILQHDLVAEHLRHTQALYMRNELCEHEQEALAVFVKDLHLPAWKANQNPVTHIKADAKLVGLSRAFAEAKAEAVPGLTPLSLSDQSRALMREHFIAVKENAQNPNQLDVVDRKKKITAYLIK